MPKTKKAPRERLDADTPSVCADAVISLVENFAKLDDAYHNSHAALNGILQQLPTAWNQLANAYLHAKGLGDLAQSPFAQMPRPSDLVRLSAHILASR